MTPSRRVLTLLTTDAHLCNWRRRFAPSLRSQEMRIRTQFRTPRWCFFTVAYKIGLFFGPKALVLDWHYPSRHDTSVNIYIYISTQGDPFASVPFSPSSKLVNMRIWPTLALLCKFQGVINMCEEAKWKKTVASGYMLWKVLWKCDSALKWKNSAITYGCYLYLSSKTKINIF